MCASLLAAPRWSRRTIETLVGRCNFARSYMEGRPLHPALAALWDLLARSGGMMSPGEEDIDAVNLIIRYCSNNRPKAFKLSEPRQQVILYTDGSCESKYSGIGGILFATSSTPRCFEERVPQEILSRWAESGIKHAIAQVELLPVWLALKVWGDLMCDTDVVLYTDNSAAKEGLVKGTSRNLASRAILFRVSELVVDLGIRVWVSRVPSLSNPADAPSRGRTVELQPWCAPVRDPVRWDLLLDELL
eukprot:6487256-Amphidinium_carterae.1